MADLIVMTNGLRERQSVGLIVVNPDGLMLAGVRKGTGYWQVPQGGRESNDLLGDAARELWEETGVEAHEVKFRRQLPGTTFYEIPLRARRREFDAQRHTWLVYDYLLPGLPNLDRAKDDEFDKIGWKHMEGRDGIITLTEPWRMPIYREVAAMMAAAA